MTSEAFFLPTEDGQRFCILHPSQAATTRGNVVYIHPFAEEMNKSRRMAALQSRALARDGFDVLQIDLLGCGDSSGDFGDATWAAWIDDVVRACDWMCARAAAPMWLWGLRAGCLLASEAAGRLQQPCNFVFWAPVPSGKVLLQQFLRLKAAGDLGSGNAKAVMAGLRDQLAHGNAVEIAGYLLAPGLTTGLERAQLAPPATGLPAGRLEWFDISTREGDGLSPVASNSIAAWEQAGYVVRSQSVQGPAFWQTTEIEEAPALLSSTLAGLAARQPEAAS